MTIEVGKWHDIVTPPEDEDDPRIERSGSGESLAKGDSHDSNEQEVAQGGSIEGTLRIINVSNIDGESAMGDS